jgi:hypothetical protein
MTTTRSVRPPVLFTGNEVAKTIGVSQSTFSRLVRKRLIRPDYQANGARGLDLFTQDSVNAIIREKDELFP